VFGVRSSAFESFDYSSAEPQAPSVGRVSAMRDIIALACQECKRRNYSTTKNKKKTSERLEFSKYCRFCRKHTSHKETK
jgi:large subunit ribosomal protein L33